MTLLSPATIMRFRNTPLAFYRKRIKGFASTLSFSQPHKNTRIAGYDKTSYNRHLGMRQIDAPAMFACGIFRPRQHFRRPPFSPSKLTLLGSIFGCLHSRHPFDENDRHFSIILKWTQGQNASKSMSFKRK